MSEELLRIDKFPTINDLRFILLEVLDRDTPIEWHELSITCKRKSIDFALSFNNTIKFLNIISLIIIYDDQSIKRNLTKAEINELKENYSLCIMITKRVIIEIERNDLLANIFNSKVVKFDINKNSFSININLIPFNFPMIKGYLLNMGIAYPDSNTHGKIFVNDLYKQLFADLILSKALGKEGSLGILTTTPIMSPKLDKPSTINSPLNTPSKGIKIFISYSHKDEHLKEELENHFSGLRMKGYITSWDDRKILPGEEWDTSIRSKLEEADIVIFLISSDFMASGYINDVEIKKTIERHNSSQCIIVPVIARPCDFSSLPISKYQALPKNAQAITTWDNRDEAFLDIVNQIKKII